MFDVIITRRAQKDLDDIWYYVAEHNMDAADALLDRFLEALLPSQLFADSGAEFSIEGQMIRKISCGSYLLLYQFNGESIELLRVIHGARDLTNVSVQ